MRAFLNLTLFRGTQDCASVPLVAAIQTERHRYRSECTPDGAPPAFTREEGAGTVNRTLRSPRYAVVDGGDPLLPRGPNVPLNKAWT